MIERYAGKVWPKLYNSITGPKGRRLSTETGDVPAIIAEIESHFTSPAKARRALGVPETTWRAWRKGTRKPKPERISSLLGARRGLRLSRGRESWMRKGHIVVHGAFQVSSEPVRDRKILVTGWPNIQGRPADEQTRGMQGRILDRFKARADLEATRALLLPLQSGVNGDMHIHQIYEIRWFRTRGEALAWINRKGQ